MTDLSARTELSPEAAITGTAGPAARNRRPGRVGRALLKHVLLIAASLVMIYPVLWMLVSSFRPTDVIFRTPGLWVNDLVIENYTEGWNALSDPFTTYLVNSAIIVIGAIAGNLLSCSLAAYAFGRLHFRGRGPMFGL